MTTPITIHTDGSSHGNPGPGGFAAIIEIQGREIEVSGGMPGATNNQMELSAVIEALKALNKLPEAEGQAATVRSDSTYVTKAFTERWIDSWRRNNFDGRPNAKLWQQLDALAKKRPVTWTWVRGHNGDPMNERCDALANRRADEAANRHEFWTGTSECNTAPGETAPEPETPPPAAPATGEAATLKQAMTHNHAAATDAELAILRHRAGDCAGALDAMTNALAEIRAQRLVLQTPPEEPAG